MKKASGDVIILHLCTKNHYPMIYASWDMERVKHNFLSFWVIFYPFTPWLYGIHHVIIFTLTIIWCKAPEIWSATDRAFCHFGLFFVLLPPNNPENQNLEKWKKCWEIMLHICTINENHMMYGSWDMERNRQNFFSFGPLFALWPP